MERFVESDDEAQRLGSELVRDLAAEASAAEGIRQGLEDVRNGRTRPARAVFDEIRAELLQPNAETMAAMTATRKGDVTTAGPPGSLLASLNADD